LIQKKLDGKVTKHSQIQQKLLHEGGTQDNLECTPKDGSRGLAHLLTGIPGGGRGLPFLGGVKYSFKNARNAKSPKTKKLWGNSRTNPLNKGKRDEVSKIGTGQ